MAKPFYDAIHVPFGWPVGIVFPVPNGCLIHTKQLRQIRLKQEK